MGKNIIKYFGVKYSKMYFIFTAELWPRGATE